MKKLSALWVLLWMAKSAWCAVGYTTVPNDPLQTRIYTLDNGLTVFLSRNTTKPTIHSYIAVKAGSSYDPADNTGLAHYLEHMLFKGTSKFGTQDRTREKLLIDRIAALYELHKKEPDAAKKKEIYHLIDSISQMASTYAIPNEFDKMMSSIGTKGVNAFTSFDQTVYTEEVPTNQLEKWAIIESERFRELVLRLFHTELEAVYEEFNIGQDDDANQAFDQLLNGLFPQHPYGTQTTIGLGTHLKNPSMLAIEKYFKKYYVPNNMAICLSGDLDFDSTIAIIDKYFGTWKKSETLRDTILPVQPIQQSVQREVFGPKEEYVLMGYGMPRLNARESMILKVADAMLANQKAGLIDLNLVQEQRVLDAASMYFILKDASTLMLKGNARQGQSLLEVKNLLTEQIDILKKGKFDATLVQAAIKFLKLRKMKEYENNEPRVMDYMDVFTRLESYESSVKTCNEMDGITKQDIVDFANKYFTYDVTILKKNGEPKGILKVEKPTITPVQTNREQESEFVKALMQKSSPSIQPVFVDFNKDIQEIKVKGNIKMQYVKNEINPTFNLCYILDMGSLHDKLLPIAAQYMPFLGTTLKSAQQIQMAFFNLGVSMDVSCTQDKVIIALSGLEESVEPAVKLLEEWMQQLQADENAWNQLREGILKEREDEKLNKEVIFWKKLSAYAQYGPSNPENYVLSNAELKKVKAEELVNKLKALMKYQHRIFYYGQKSVGEAKSLIENNHQTNAMLLQYPVKKEFPQVSIQKNQVFLVHYNMVQTEIGMLALDVKYDPLLVPAGKLFNEYFGGSMGSVVFQEIRESKALAYSTFSAYIFAREKEKNNMVMAYVGTQADKMKLAIDAMRDLLNNMPFAENLFQLSKDGMLKSIATERINGVELFNQLEQANKLGLKEDIRKQVYAFIQKASFEDIKQFYQSHVQNKKYIYSVLGNKDQIDRKSLAQYGDISDIAIETLFGY